MLAFESMNVAYLSVYLDLLKCLLAKICQFDEQMLPKFLNLFLITSYFLHWHFSPKLRGKIFRFWPLIIILSMAFLIIYP